MFLEVTRPKLGNGIYTIPDTANILGIPSRTVRYWSKKIWDERLAEKGGSKYTWGEGKDKALDFYTMIELYIFHNLRKLKITPSKIFLAHRKISEALQSPYPFAHAKILSDGKEVFFQKELDIVNANDSLQFNLKEIVSEFMIKIDYDEGLLAQRYWPIGKKRNIVVDPQHQFGQPTINGTNILAETIYHYYQSGESINFIANIFEIKNHDVTAAIEFYNQAA